MIFRYDFGSKLNLLRFKAQSQHYISKYPEITYCLFFYNYKLVANIKQSEEELDQLQYLTTISIFDIQRDSDGEIATSNVVIPLTDVRFKELKEIVDIFPTDRDKGFFKSVGADNTSDAICRVITILYKINKLKAFL